MPARCPSPPLKSAAAPGRRPGVVSLLIMGVVTILLHRCEWGCGQLSGTRSYAALRPANAEIRPDCGCRLVGTTPTAYRSIYTVLNGYGLTATVLSSLVSLKFFMNIPLSVSSKLPPLRPRKSRPLRRNRRKARSPGLKGITLTSSLLLAG